MELWNPEATQVIPLNYTGDFLNRYEKQVLHTTESYNYTPSPNSYYGHQLWPHATLARYLGEWRLFQHLPLSRVSACMRNLQGGVETNRDGCIQIEIAWKAQDALNFPTGGYELLRSWLSWVSSQTGIPYRFLDNFHHYPPENGHRLGQEPWRLRGAEFDSFTGILGHQHADENVHGDPGKIDVSKLKLVEEEELVAARHAMTYRADLDRADEVVVGTDFAAWHRTGSPNPEHERYVRKQPFTRLGGQCSSVEIEWCGEFLTVSAQGRANGKPTTELFHNVVKFGTTSGWSGFVKSVGSLAP